MIFEGGEKNPPPFVCFIIFIVRVALFCCLSSVTRDPYAPVFILYLKRRVGTGNLSLAVD